MQAFCLGNLSLTGSHIQMQCFAFTHKQNNQRLMKAIVCTTPGLLEYKEIVFPALQPGHSMIRIKNICICGTDFHAFEGTQPYFSYPRILGHELSGELVDFDDAPGFVRGEQVSFIPYFNCGKCIACRTGKPNCCSSIKVCGVHIDGGMVEYLSVPSYSLIHSNGLSLVELAMVEPMAIGAHGIRRAAVSQGEYVLVMGAGPIGLGTMEFARIAGGNVIAMDLNTDRLSFCKEQLHIKHIVNANDADALLQLLDITKGDMPPVVIDATGNQKAINNGLHYLAHGGRYILIGLQKNELVFSHPEFHKREATLMSSRNATREDFEHVIACMKNGSLNPVPFITNRLKFDELKQQFASLLDPSNHVIKAMVEME
jgi:2-desacetyl-2-hydroxyethyl bacteriochlorophyllide A dehydrogenase